MLEGKTIWELFPADVAEILEPRYRAALAGEASAFEVPFAEGIYALHALPIRDERGEIVAGMAMTQDITARKQTEAQLRASEAELRALFAAMTDVILVLDAQGRYLKVPPTKPTCSWVTLRKPCEPARPSTWNTACPSPGAKSGSRPRSRRCRTTPC